MSEPDVRTPRLAVWGFAWSLAGFVLSFVSIADFVYMLYHPHAGGDLLFLHGNNRILPLLPWGLLSIPGLVLSLLGRRVARKRRATETWALVGIVLGSVGTMASVLYIWSWGIVFIWGMAHGSWE